MDSYLLAKLSILLRDPIKVIYDNISATYVTTNPILHDCSKHNKVDYHFVCEHVSHGNLIVTYVPTQFHLADIFTKAFPIQHFLLLKFNLFVGCPFKLRGIIEGSRRHHIPKYVIIFVNPSCTH